MPNWVNNKVTVEGENTDKAVKCLLKKGFNCAKKMPKKIKNTKAFEENKKLKRKYGYSDWYSWAIANWGTKWNINSNNIFIHIMEKDYTLLDFDTAWSCPEPVIKKLSKKYKVQIEVVAIEEGNQSISHFIYKNGKLLLSEDALDLLDPDEYETWKEVLSRDELINELDNINDSLCKPVDTAYKYIDDYYEAIVERFNNDECE